MSTISGGAYHAANPKLPLRQTITLSYSIYFHNFSDVLRISWLWLALIVPLTVATSWLQATWLAQVMTDMASGRSSQTLNGMSAPIWFAALGNLTGLILTFAGVSIAVAWHRRLLLDETPGLSGSNVATRSLWRYIGVGIAICLIIALPAAAILVPIFFWLLPHISSGVNEPTNPAILLLFLVIYVAAFAVMLRLIPLLPARAIADLTLTFKQVWKRTRGNAWRILWGLVACSTPPLVVLEIIDLVLVGFPNPETIGSGENFVIWVATGIVFSCGNLLFVPIWVGFLSYAYRHFFNPAQADTYAS